jgi:hypothetical protein
MEVESLDVLTSPGSITVSSVALSPGDGKGLWL